jgi:cytochrome b subunit of formate dehydrogenase
MDILILLYLHIGSALLWVGPTTGAYVLMRSTNDSRLIPIYRKMVTWVELPSAITLFLTGLTMAWLLGFPPWSKVALGMAPFMATAEVVHYLSCSKGIDMLRRNVDKIAAFWTVVTPFLLYLMIFQPKL